MNRSHITVEQQEAISRLYEHDNTLLIASKGFGKACVAQTAAQELLDDGIVKRVLIIAPAKVCALTWATEWQKWEHLEEPGMLTGTAGQRRQVLRSDKRILVASVDNLVNVVLDIRNRCPEVDGLVVDEISRLKEVGGKNFKALRPLLKRFVWRVGLSATPVAESGVDLYAQMLIVDGGKSLGTRKEKFLNTYFISDYSGYKFEYQFKGEERLAAAVKDYVWVAPDTDYQDSLPPLHEEVIEVDMPLHGRQAYEEMAQTMILEAEDIEAVNAGVLAGKLQQIASGFIYREVGGALFLHDTKFRKLEELMAEVDGNVIVVYNYIEELERLKQMFPDAPVLADNPEKAQAMWNAGEAPVLLMHPRSGGHGLNLQDGGCTMIAMGPCWSSDAWDQVIGRLWRRGQANAVTRYTLACSGTIDESILLRLADKVGNEKILMNHLAEVTSR